MSKFITALVTRRVGSERAVLEQPLQYESEKIGRVVVPAGFETDFASVPRLPVMYWLTGDTAHEAAVVHDYLYSTGIVSRSTADAVFLEAMAAMNVPSWRRVAMWIAVRAFGWSSYASSR